MVRGPVTGIPASRAHPSERGQIPGAWYGGLALPVTTSAGLPPNVGAVPEYPVNAEYPLRPRKSETSPTGGSR
jgi:hypothetical protein